MSLHNLIGKLFTSKDSYGKFFVWVPSLPLSFLPFLIWKGQRSSLSNLKTQYFQQILDSQSYFKSNE